VLPFGLKIVVSSFSGAMDVILSPEVEAHFAKNTTHYLFPEYFQILRPKKKKINTNVQNGHRLFLGQLQIDSNMHPLRLVTFPV
jgi:hypothetical protein